MGHEVTDPDGAGFDGAKADGSAPSPAPRHRRRKEARPGELLDAALTLFAERGYSATRIDDIAARAGVSKGTLYLYFPSKQDVFKALVREAVIPNIERLEHLVADHSGPAAAALRQVLTRLGGLLQRQPRLAALPKLIITEAANFPDLARFYLDTVIRRGTGLIEGLVRRGIAAGEFRPVDPRATAKLCVAPILFLALWRHSFEPHDDAPIDSGAFVELHVDTLLRGLAATSTPPGPIPEGRVT